MLYSPKGRHGFVCQTRWSDGSYYYGRSKPKCVEHEWDGPEAIDAVALAMAEWDADSEIPHQRPYYEFARVALAAIDRANGVMCKRCKLYRRNAE